MTVVSVAASTGSTISLAPRSAAVGASGDVRAWVYTFSSTTTALSMMSPKPMASPISVSTFSVSPPK
jgi:hypothetical protein